MLSYQKKILTTIKEVGVSDESILQEMYADVEAAFLERWGTVLISKLSAEDQQFVEQKMAEGATHEQLYEFLDATLDDIESINQSILNEFITEYRQQMGLA